MALIGNRSVLLKSPGRFLSGTVASIERSNCNKPGMMVGRFETFNKITGGTPTGYLSPASWALPRTAGGMSSINSAALTIGLTGTGVGGITTTGTASITFTVAPASGELIAFGTGAATMTFTPTGTLLASISGAGSAAFSVSTNTPTLGALASGSGAATMAFSAAGDILPTDDTSPVRTASASFSFSATLTPYAIGHMEGSTVDSTVLTSDAIASAVWGQVIEAGFSAEQIVRLLAAHAAGAATGLEGANPQFTGLDGSTIRIDGTYSAGTRTIDALDGD